MRLVNVRPYRLLASIGDPFHACAAGSGRSMAGMSAARTLRFGNHCVRKGGSLRDQFCFFPDLKPGILSSFFCRWRKEGRFGAGFFCSNVLQVKRAESEAQVGRSVSSKSDLATTAILNRPAEGAVSTSPDESSQKMRLV